MPDMVLPSAMLGGNTFSGVRFWILRSGPSLPSMPHEEEINVQHIPYGDTSIIQVGGRKASTLSINAMVKIADWPAFISKRGQSGTLSLVTGENRAMVMSAITNVQRFQHGFYQCQASFIG